MLYSPGCSSHDRRGRSSEAEPHLAILKRSVSIQETQTQESPGE